MHTNASRSETYRYQYQKKDTHKIRVSTRVFVSILDTFRRICFKTRHIFLRLDLNTRNVSEDVFSISDTVQRIFFNSRHVS